jgi:hypothetical protein
MCTQVNNGIVAYMKIHKFAVITIKVEGTQEKKHNKCTDRQILDNIDIKKHLLYKMRLVQPSNSVGYVEI